MSTNQTGPGLAGIYDVERPDAATLRRLHHEEGLTLGDIAAQYGVSVSAVSRWFSKLEIDVRRRRAREKPPTAKPQPKYLKQRAEIVRDYTAGDPQLVLEARYGIPQQTVAREIQAAGLETRGKTEAAALRSSQIAEADAVRYRLRTGALEGVADELGVDAGKLRATLDAHGLLLHDLR